MRDRYTIAAEVRHALLVGGFWHELGESKEPLTDERLSHFNSLLKPHYDIPQGRVKVSVSRDPSNPMWAHLNVTFEPAVGRISIGINVVEGSIEVETKKVEEPTPEPKDLLADKLSPWQTVKKVEESEEPKPWWQGAGCEGCPLNKGSCKNPSTHHVAGRTFCDECAPHLGAKAGWKFAQVKAED